MIAYTEKDNNIFIKGSGHITAEFCSAVKESVFVALAKNDNFDGFYVDLSDCTYMDSTFIGLLAGFNKKYRAQTGRKIKIQNICGECLDLLNSMGLTRLLEVLETPVDFPADIETVKQKEKTSIYDILEAHENLMELSDENKKKFTNLHKALKDAVPEEK
ncbi:MAG: STAS domain-containing protein [Treponemataceae bacterium]